MGVPGPHGKILVPRPGDVWVIGGSVAHFDGQGWSTIPAGDLPQIVSSTAITRRYGEPSRELLLVGQDGVAYAVPSIDAAWTVALAPLPPPTPPISGTL